MMKYEVCVKRDPDSSINLAVIHTDGDLILPDLLDTEQALCDNPLAVADGFIAILGDVGIGGGLSREGGELDIKVTEEGIHIDHRGLPWLMLIPENLYNQVYYAGYGRSSLLTK